MNSVAVLVSVIAKSMTECVTSPLCMHVCVGIMFVIGIKSSEFITLSSCVARVSLYRQPHNSMGPSGQSSPCTPSVGGGVAGSWESCCDGPTVLT